LKIKHETGAGYARRPRARYLLAMVVATVMGLGLALPAFAAQEPGAQPRIIGGDPVPTGKYPFVAALLDTTRGNTPYEQQFCGGSLIDADSVLTAAHCVQGQVPQPLEVTVGRTTLNNSNEGQTEQVSRIQIHPRYNGVTNEAHDAAVLTLSNRIVGIAPIRIPPTTSNSFERPGYQARIAGWGNTIKQNPNFSQPDAYPNRMREAVVPIVSDNTGENVYTTSYFSTLMVSAGREGKDTCQGDSGGPLFAQTQSGRFQIGITSFGAGCGARGFPGVYAETNAGPIRNFIFTAAAG
jgi:secreted trypsin-like serine protease